MYWSYDQDLSEYTLGQGGYYSPQQYYSIGVPLNYAFRTANWSVSLNSESDVVVKSEERSTWAALRFNSPCG